MLNLKSKGKWIIRAAITLVIVALGALIFSGFFANNGDGVSFSHHREGCRSFHGYPPNDARRPWKLGYFDVITVEAHIPYRSVLPSGSDLTDDIFSKMALDIFTAEFNKGCKGSGVIIGEYGHPYSLDTNPFLARIIFSLVKREDGKFHLIQTRQRRHLAEWFNESYDEDGDTIDGKKIEDIINDPIKIKKMMDVEISSNERDLWNILPDSSNFKEELTRVLYYVSGRIVLQSVTGKSVVDKYNPMFLGFLREGK